MAIRKLLGCAALAAGIATGYQANASGVNGDIYDIRPCEYDGTTRGPWATPADPLESGVTAYFKIRLIQGAQNDAATTWFIDHVGPSSQIVDDALYPLQVGVYVSGQLRPATLVDSKADSPSAGFTELVFEYKTMPGDFAMPIVLATESGPATASNGGSAFSYLFYRTDKWKITNNNGGDCNLWFWTQDASQGLGWPVADPDGGRTLDYSLRQAGLYVKTIDFDSNWESPKDSADPLWRSVHEESDITIGSTPSLMALAASSNSVTLHVWSTDDTAVRIKGGTPTDLIVDYDAGSPVYKNTLVGEITIAGGQTYRNFEIEGVSMAGGPAGDGKCELVLSPWDNYTYNSSNIRQVDYVTVPVKCVEPLPTSLFVGVENDPSYAKVGEGWKSYSTTLDVHLSQPLAEDIEVTVTPSVADHVELNMADYVKFSKTATSVKTIAALSDTVTVTIPAGQLRSSVNPKIYVYFLKGDEFTSGGSTIDFTPSISAAQQASTGLNTDDRFVAGSCEVVAEALQILAPENGSELVASAGVPLDVEIELAATYAGQQIAAPADGYKIEVSYNGQAYKTLEGWYYIGAGNLLRSADGSLPAITFPTSGANVPTRIRVTDAINNDQRPVVTLNATVAAPKTASVVADKDTYNEGESAKFTVQLNADNDTGAALYAFLVAGPDTVTKGMFKALGRQCVVTPDMTDADYATTSGLVINPDNGGPDKPVIGTVKLLDGESESVGGSSFYFTVVLCTTPAYDPATVVAGYNSNFATIQVFNLEPTITRVELNGYEPLETGYFEGKYPVGQAQTLQAIVKDAGGFDLDNGFHTRWTITRIGGGIQIPVDDIEGNPNEDAQKKTVTFSQAGTYKIKVQVKDKDMEDWSSEYNETYIEVVAQPQLSLVIPDVVDEDSSRQTIKVGLGGYYNAAEPMVVMLTVIPPVANAVNPGILTFDSLYSAIPAGFEALANAAIAAEDSANYDHYYIAFSGADDLDLAVVELDGTVLSLSPGFSVKVQVLNDGVSSDPAKTWAQYYLPNTQRFYINNKTPKWTYSEPSDGTNRWELSSAVATQYPIRWTVRSDVDNDYTGLWDDGQQRGIRISFSGCENAADGLRYVTSRIEGTSGVFVPNFGTAQGELTVTMTIEDKDGGYETVVYQYLRKPSKMLDTVAHGPNGGISSSRLSQKYSQQGDGIGMGHVYVRDGAFAGANNFTLSWDCGRGSEVRAYAMGYKVGAPDDDGTLDNGYDRAIDQTGYADSAAVPQNFFHYPYADMSGSNKKDSFFYCWLMHSRGQNDGAQTSSYLDGAIAPERPGTPGVQRGLSEGVIPLPTQATADGSYPKVIVEAVFSREWRPADNLGDINQDGIPDYFAIRDWSNGNLIQLKTGGTGGGGEGGEGGSAITENDTTGLRNENPDEDLLPGVYTENGLLQVYDDGPNSYAPIGAAFDNLFEIRGFHNGLNAIDCTTSDPDFSDDEQAAYKWYFVYAQTNLVDNPQWTEADGFNEWTEADGFDLTFWSPEPSGDVARMDPTTEDTDGDGFPDGWEYFFWYQAHVWAPADARRGQPRQNSLQRYVFERFNFEDPMHGIPIAFSEVEAHFNPCTKWVYNKEKVSSYDLDGDGLSELEELAIGTNPCHWDSDGDGMCDSYEVMMLLNPLSPTDRRTNTDDDYMALHKVADDFVYFDPDGAQDAESLDAVMYGVITELQANVDYDPMSNSTLRDLEVEAFKFKAKEDPNNAGTILRYGENMPRNDTRWNDDRWNLMMADEIEHIVKLFIPSGTTLNKGINYLLVHDQVYKAFTFDPRTGWYRTNNGYVANRWDPAFNSQNVGQNDVTGSAVNTQKFYAYDEYLVMMYRKLYGIEYAGENPRYSFPEPDDTSTNVTAIVLAKTSNPSVYQAEEGEGTDAANLDTIADDLAEAFSEAYSAKEITRVHGADTDEDGVPDGWELYTFRSPNDKWTNDRNPELSDQSPQGLNTDYDGDRLTYGDEFAGTDSCNQYRNCATVYTNHPGIRTGWFNKFFPTNPGDYDSYGSDGDPVSHDTDGDGVGDAFEGRTWYGDFYNGGNTYNRARLGFVYGNPVDNGRDLCIRGGGMNPNTVDTDLDGIPDGWEVCYAGVPVSLETLNPVNPGKNGGANDMVTAISDDTLRADGINRDNWTAREGVYIAGGMDATWNGDAYATESVGDPLFNNNYRDVDFDHDGLQNYQEYLIQTVRHFRYDDITTPLMGRQLQEGQYNDNNELESPHTQQFCGFVPMVADDPETLAVDAAEAWGLEDYVLWVTQTNSARVETRTLDDGTVKTNIHYYTERVRKLVDGDTLVHHMVDNTSGMYSLPWTTEGWRKLGYFAPPLHTWDRSVACSKYDNPKYLFPVLGDITGGGRDDNMVSIAGVGYIATDPRMSDTDKDGMDDYYEMFHGLNPILGTIAEDPDDSGIPGMSSSKYGDIISAVYAAPSYPMPDTRPTFNAFYNEWTHPDYNRYAAMGGEQPTGNDPASGQNAYNGVSRTEAIGAPEAYDPILYPWLMGSPAVDADGDGLRNDEERIVVNLADPLTHHTDPSPAWFTERSTPASYVAQYYKTPETAQNAPLMANGYMAQLIDIATDGWNDNTYIYGFEENEGYDTDSDFVPDSREVISPTLAPADPLRFDTPDRRQALYLDGVDSYAISKELQYRGVEAIDLLKQFTVECWICPEKSGVAQTIVDRAVAVPGSGIDKDKMAIRSNFRIGLAPSGAVYGMIDNNDSIESGYNQPISCQRVDGKILPLNKWSHVALSYNGSELAIYVNGRICTKAQTTLVPANGVDRIFQGMGDLAALTAESMEDRYDEALMYRNEPSAFIIGARPKRENTYALYPSLVEDGEHKESFDNLQEFYQGYVDEVRVWDGARTAEEIEANYLHRMTFEDVAENRQSVFNGWVNGATRNNNDNNDMLPSELVMHYNFASLAGAVDASKVAQYPIGFMSKTLGASQFSYDESDNPDITLDGLYANIKELKGGADGEVLWTDDDGNERALEIGWWKESRVHSSVYGNYNYVPWIQNTVAHLPRIDGASPDSFVYGEKRAAGYSIPEDIDYQSFVFPNSADPYPYSVYYVDRYERLLTAERFVEVRGNDYSDFLSEVQFQYRNNFIGCSDLVPLGHAYAKTTSKYWDGAASDPWEYTDEDSNANGLPDWWEIYARENYCQGVLGVDDDLNWDTYINYRNLQIPAWQAYLIDLNRGMQPDGQVDPAYASTFDSDRDGLPDWWEKMFGVFDYGADDDTDGDGLSNYAEYLLTEVFDLGVVFDPANAFSVSFYDSDYFYKVGDLYAGAVFTDHDMMEDAWELQCGLDYVNSCAWDALSDNDDDRWSAFAECRYNSFVSSTLAGNVSHMLGDAELKDFPVPTLKLALRYNQSQPLTSQNSGSVMTGDNQEMNSLAPIVVKTFTYKATQELNVVPDATFTINPGESITRVFYLGMYGDRMARGTLTPGYVEPGSFTLEMAQLAQNNNYSWTVRTGDATRYKTGTYAEYIADYNRYGNNRVTLQSEEFKWEPFEGENTITVSQDGDSPNGYIRMQGERIGTINTVTGEFELDLSTFGKWSLQSTNTTYSLREAVFRAQYKAKVPLLQSNKLSIYLGTANVGAVREGKNRIVAFYDLNNDGNYTPGEPLGFANDVDVGWKQGVCELELTDTSPVITRADLSQISASGSTGDALQDALAAITGGGASGGDSGNAASDRYVLYGTEDGDCHALVVGALSGGSYQRIRVVRTLVNGYGIQYLNVPNSVVVDKWLELDQRPFFFEGDVLENGVFDLDWDLFTDEVVNNPGVAGRNIDPTEVTYRIVLGNGTIDTDATNNLYSIATVRHFDTTAARPAPTTIAPGNTEAVVYGSRPTFKWRLGPDGTVFNSYPAFRIQVMNTSGTVVWDSGLRRTPAMNLDGVYSYTPDVYAGDVIKVDQRYTWRVSMYNSKFRTDKWSDNSPSFQMFTQDGVHGYGAINVCVKYFGPANVLNAGAVRVEAFDTPDFSGFPAARTYVSSKASVNATDVEHEANARLVGLPDGTYYVRAYIDINSTNGTTYAKDKWESWGYVCPREVNPALMFSPTAIEVGSESAALRTFTLYIEDSDTNGNCLPDAWEILKNGRLSTGAASVTVIGGSTVANDSLAGGLSGKLNADHVAARLASQVFSAMYAADGASLVTDVEVTDPNGTYSGVMVGVAASSQTELADVKVKALSVEGGKVVLKVEGEPATSQYVQSMLTAGSSEVLVESEYRFNAVVKYTDDLASGVWRTAAVKPVTITVYSDGSAKTTEIDLSDFANGDKCFFKVSFEDPE